MLKRDARAATDPIHLTGALLIQGGGRLDHQRGNPVKAAVPEYQGRFHGNLRSVCSGQRFTER